MRPSEAVRKIADELEGYEPVPDTFKGVRDDPIAGAKIAIRMAVALLRERADDLDVSDLAENGHR